MEQPPFLNLDRCRTLMELSDVDALVVASRENFGYIAGAYFGNYLHSPLPHFVGHDHRISPRQDPSRSVSWGFIVVPRDERKDVFAVVHGYMSDIVRGIWIRDVRAYGTWTAKPQEDPVDLLAQGLLDKDLGTARIGIEWRFPAGALEALRRRLPQARFTDAERLLWRLREVKSPEEISRMRKAANATVKAFTTALDAATEGMTEIEFTDIMQRTYIEEGCQRMWSEISFGLRPKQGREIGSWTPTENVLKRGDFCFLDGGGCYRMYVADMARCFWFGRDPTSDERTSYGALLDAMDAAGEMVRPGVRCSEIYRTVHDLLDHESYGSTGHGVGLLAHESPCLSETSDEILEEGMVLTLEIIATPTVDGHPQHQQCEDEFLVTSGGAELLTKLPRWITR